MSHSSILETKVGMKVYGNRDLCMRIRVKLSLSKKIMKSKNQIRIQS